MMNELNEKYVVIFIHVYPDIIKILLPVVQVPEPWQTLPWTSGKHNPESLGLERRRGFLTKSLARNLL